MLSRKAKFMTFCRDLSQNVREAPFNKSPPLFGHCPNSIYTPPRTQTGTLGHFFSGAILPFYHFYHFVYHFLWISAPNHPGKGLDPPQNQANARLNLENSSLKKCPKPSGQGFRPPPPNGQCPNRGGALLKGASLSWLVNISSVKSILEPAYNLHISYI